MKKALSLVLVLVMLVGMMPMQVFATEGTQETEAVEVVTEPTEAPEEETTAPAEETEPSDEEEETEPSEPSESEEEPEVVHEHDYEAVVTDPTCTEQGYTTYTCECGDNYVDDHVDAIGHTYKNGICTGCGEEDYDGLDLNGLNVLCLGDSITAGQGLTTDTRWTNVLASKYGWKLRNNSQGGIALSSYYYTANGTYDYSIAKKAEVLKTMTTKPDVIVVWGGHNDTSYRASPLGTWDDETTNSFKGALKHIAELAAEYAPDATLFVLTPLWVNEKPSTLKVPANTSDNNWMFVDAIYEGADTYGWIPINMDLCGITPFTKSGLLLDNIHPNEAGTEKIVAYLSEELASYGANSKKETIIFNASAVSMKPGESTTLKAVLSPRSGTGTMTFTWSSSDSSVATVDTSGKITAVAPGTAVITATAPNGISADISVSVVCEHTYEPSVTAPTCTEQGYTTYTCECGDSYVADYVDAIGHNWSKGICTFCGEGKKPYQRRTYFTVQVEADSKKYSDNAVLYLPTNYSPDGEPVKLVIYCKQGSSQITSSSNPIESTGFYNYLISLGYAVLGVDGVPDAWCDELGLDNTRVVGNPLAVQGTEKAYDYVVDNYNIDANGCFISGYSQGGHYAQNVIDLTDIPILAAAEQSPVCSMRYHQWDLNASKTVGGVKFTRAARLNVARIYGFPAVDSNSELLNLAYDANLVAEYDPWVRNSTNVYTGFVQKSNLWYLPEGTSIDDITMTHAVKCPVKIWCAEDDTAISADVMKVFVKAIQNAGGTAEISIASSGGHGFFQKQTAVGSFTENGKTYNTLPIAVEIADWFAQYGGYEHKHTYENGTCTVCGATQPGPVITQQPESVQQEVGKKFAITVKAEGEGLTYQWYVKEAGTKEFKVSVNKTSSYAYTMQTYMHNRQVYCVITDANGNSVQTETATITRPPQALRIVEQPQDAQQEIGQKFSIKPSVQGDGLTYQWYYKESYMKDFAVSSNKTSAYAYTMQSYMHNRSVYCVITDQYGNQVTTDVATISLPPVELKILEQPADVYASKGEKFSIKPTIQGDGLTYQWYYKEGYMKDFKLSSNKTSAYAYSMQTYMNERSVYCVITDKYGNQVVTEVVTIHLEK